MSDPLGRASVPLVPSSNMESRIDIVRLRRERSIAALKNSLVLPDVWIADRSDCSQPVVLGEDGKEMTFERRQEMMRGKQPMFMDGKATETDYRAAFDQDIVPEPLGSSAVKNRPGMRILPTKDMEIAPKLDTPENH
jgi:hypothetical protein